MIDFWPSTAMDEDPATPQTIVVNGVDFIDLVFRMRTAQSAYFARRKSEDLIEAKRLERLVDTAILRLRER